LAGGLTGASCREDSWRVYLGVSWSERPGHEQERGTPVTPSNKSAPDRAALSCGDPGGATLGPSQRACLPAGVQFERRRADEPGALSPRRP
jgi:hypothetical protein